MGGEKRMIAIIASNYREAEKFAASQLLSNDEWFFVCEIDDLIGQSNFHVLVANGAGDHISPYKFEKLFSLAKKKGKMK